MSGVPSALTQDWPTSKLSEGRLKVEYIIHFANNDIHEVE